MGNVQEGIPMPPYVTAIVGYAVVFIGLALLMFVIILVGKVMTARTSQNMSRNKAPLAGESGAAEASVSVPAAAPAAKKPLAPGSAGELKLYDTDPRDAAMIMAIVANNLQKPLNELRFISIKEVKE